MRKKGLTMDGHIGHCCPPACLHTDILTGYSSFTDRTHHALSLSIVMAAIAQLAQGIAARNLVGVEAAAAHEYIKRQQDVSPAAPTATPTTTIDDAAAISTLLSAYLSANPSLQTANAEIISLISSYALAQAAYNSALERGETPPPPVLAVPVNTGTVGSTILASATSTPSGNNTIPAMGRSSTASLNTTSTAAPTGAAYKTQLVSKMSMLGLCGLLAVLVLAA